MAKALLVLLNQLNAQLQSLNKDGFRLYDDENIEFYISDVYYSEEADKLYFRCEEEE